MQPGVGVGVEEGVFVGVGVDVGVFVGPGVGVFVGVGVGVFVGPGVGVFVGECVGVGVRRRLAGLSDTRIRKIALQRAKPLGAALQAWANVYCVTSLPLEAALAPPPAVKVSANSTLAITVKAAEAANKRCLSRMIASFLLL